MLRYRSRFVQSVEDKTGHCAADEVDTFFDFPALLSVVECVLR